MEQQELQEGIRLRALEALPARALQGVIQQRQLEPLEVRPAPPARALQRALQLRQLEAPEEVRLALPVRALQGEMQLLALEAPVEARPALPVRALQGEMRPRVQPQAAAATELPARAARPLRVEVLATAAL